MAHRFRDIDEMMWHYAYEETNQLYLCKIRNDQEEMKMAKKNQIWHLYFLLKRNLFYRMAICMEQPGKKK